MQCPHKSTASKDTGFLEHILNEHSSKCGYIKHSYVLEPTTDAMHKFGFGLDTPAIEFFFSPYDDVLK